MTDQAAQNPSESDAQAAFARPARVTPQPVPPIPEPTTTDGEEMSTIYSRYRTKLSNHRTGLSEHRTDLSEFRTDLSTERTGMSVNRTDMAKRRTGMAIQRTRMAADRTLMAEIRTSLSMIGFGFTIYQAFKKLALAGTIANAKAPGNFGATLIILGIAILFGGIWRHVQFARELRGRRKEMIAEGLLHGDSAYPISVTFLVSIGLFIVGLLALGSVVFDLSLFG